MIENNSVQNAVTPWMTKKEIAQHLRCSVRHISRLMKRKIIPFVKDEKFVRFNPSECDQALSAFKSKSIFSDFKL